MNAVWSVIPAQAGIQYQALCEAHSSFNGELRTRTRLDPGLRRDDEIKNAT